MSELVASTVTTERGRFCVRDQGPEAGTTPVVMLHGWPESSYCWTRVASRLSGGLRVIAPDLRGLGDSERTPDVQLYQKHALAKDVIAVLDKLGIERFCLVGHDWGGAVAQEMAFAVPERIERLALMNIPVVNNRAGNREAIARHREQDGYALWYQHFQQTGLPEAMIPGNEEAWLGYFLRTWSPEGFPEDAFREFVRCYAIPGTPGTGASYYRTMGEDAKRWATLTDHRFPMPALYVYGNKDPVIIPEYLNHHRDCFEDVRLVEIEAGHFVEEEQPGQVAEALNDFLG